MSAGFMGNPKKSPFGSKKPRLTLQVSDPIAGDDGITCIASVDVLNEDGDAMIGVGVQFYLDGEHSGGPIETRSDGRATKKLTRLEVGKHTFGVCLTNKPEIKKFHSFKVEPEHQSTPSDFTVELVGANGNYSLMIKVVDANGRAVPRVRFIVCDTSGADLDVSSFSETGDTTNRFGTTMFVLRFCEPQRFVSIIPMHAGLKKKEIRLFGARRT